MLVLLSLKYTYIKDLRHVMVSIIIIVSEHLTHLNVFILTTPLWGREVQSFPFYRWETET